MATLHINTLNDAFISDLTETILHILQNSTHQTSSFVTARPGQGGEEKAILIQGAQRQ